MSWIAATHATRTAVTGLLGTWMLAVACASPGRPTPSPPVKRDGVVAVSGSVFEFHSGMWMNMHHFLYAIARARTGRSAPAVLADTIGLGARGEDERRAWDAAVAHYARELAERDAVFDTSMTRLKDRLAAAEATASLRLAGPDSALAAILDAAAPVYRTVWWSRHDAANRAWIQSMLPLLDRYGEALATGITRAFEATWPKPFLRVDVVYYANWAGAYGTENHVTISSTDGGYKGLRGLEMLFHEAAHAIPHSLAQTLRQVSAESGTQPPFGVLHPIIFFTAGELTRRLVPDYTPFAEAGGFWHGNMGRYLPAIQRHWLPHIDGKANMRDALRAIVSDSGARP